MDTLCCNTRTCTLKQTKRKPTKPITAYLNPTGRYSITAETELVLLKEEVYRVEMNKEMQDVAPSKILLVCYSYQPELRIHFFF